MIGWNGTFDVSKMTWKSCYRTCDKSPLTDGLTLGMICRPYIAIILPITLDDRLITLITAAAGARNELSRWRWKSPTSPRVVPRVGSGKFNSPSNIDDTFRGRVEVSDNKWMINCALTSRGFLSVPRQRRATNTQISLCFIGQSLMHRYTATYNLNGKAYTYDFRHFKHKKLWIKMIFFHSDTRKDFSSFSFRWKLRTQFSCLTQLAKVDIKHDTKYS